MPTVGPKTYQLFKQRRALGMSREQFRRHLDDQERRRTLQYISSAQRTRDTLALIPKLPPNLAGVCGIARSGVAPAVEIAMTLHLPLFTLDDTGVQNPGSGYRLRGNHTLRPGPILVIDDSCGTGRSQRRARPVAQKHWPDRELIFAALYINPKAKTLPDLHVRDIGRDHIFEWNILNSPFWRGQFGCDFDGIFCEDWPGGIEDERYATWISDVAAIRLPRRDAISLIATARLEKHRAATLAWLGRHRVRVDTLAMWPGDESRRTLDRVAEFKAEHYKRNPRLRLFIESDARLAERIFDISGKPVLCPAADTVFK